MKYLVLIAVVLLVLWFLRNQSRGASEEADARRAPPAQPQDMVQCAVCSVHLPRTDALPGPDGRLYCCVEHRNRISGT